MDARRWETGVPKSVTCPPLPLRQQNRRRHRRHNCCRQRLLRTIVIIIIVVAIAIIISVPLSSSPPASSHPQHHQHHLHHQHHQHHQWLLNVPCVPLLPTTLPNLFHACQPVLIGLQATHGSHKLAYKRGIWWCVACGSWTSSAARNLSRPCTGQATKAARDVLTRLEKGLTPQPHVLWQSPHH